MEWPIEGFCSGTTSHRLAICQTCATEQAKMLLPVSEQIVYLAVSVQILVCYCVYNNSYLYHVTECSAYACMHASRNALAWARLVQDKQLLMLCTVLYINARFSLVHPCLWSYLFPRIRGECMASSVGLMGLCNYRFLWCNLKFMHVTL